MSTSHISAITPMRVTGRASLPDSVSSLGRTGCDVTQFGLGGEGVLRTHGRMAEAVAVIHRALDHGVTYCDTAPAYAGSLDYYGAALGERRSQVFLASKTHDRTRDGSLRLLDESLKRSAHRSSRLMATARSTDFQRLEDDLQTVAARSRRCSSARRRSGSVSWPDRASRPGHTA